MKNLYRLTIIILIPLFLIWTITCADAKPSTHYTPETVDSKPVERGAEIKPEKKGINWLWVLVGVAVVGGIAAAAGGGGGSSSSTTTTTTDPGTVDFGW